LRQQGDELPSNRRTNQPDVEISDEDARAAEQNEQPTHDHGSDTADQQDKRDNSRFSHVKSSVNNFVQSTIEHIGDIKHEFNHHHVNISFNIFHISNGSNHKSNDGKFHISL